VDGGTFGKNRTWACGVMFVVLIASLLFGVSRADALPHGCVSAAKSHWASADAARRGIAVTAWTNEPCSFYYEPGDTWSGAGAFIIKCSTGGEINHPDFQGGQYPPILNQPIPQPCKPGAKVTILNNQPFQGGGVVAGGASLPASQPQPQPQLPSAKDGTYEVRYVVPPLQAPQFDETKDVPIAPFGMFTIVPNRNRVTVSIHDDVTPDGSFLFKICQKNEAHPGDSYCGEGHDDRSTGDICYTRPTTLRRIVPGNPVEVTLWFAPSPCSDAPVTGTLKIVG
jgi:hypothetical protein